MTGTGQTYMPTNKEALLARLFNKEYFMEMFSKSIFGKE